MTNSLFLFRLITRLALFPIILTGISAFCQDHGVPAEKTGTIPDELQSQLVGRWGGMCTYNSESKEFILDVIKNETRYEYFWSIYQTGNVSRKIYKAGYDKTTNQITLDGFLFLRSNSGGEIQATLKRHDFVAEFNLKKIEKISTSFLTEPVSFTNKEVTLAGTLYKPKDKGPHPAIVFLHGSGSATRWDWAPYFAEKFAELGFISLIFDKRGCGESTGSWIEASLDDLSWDAIAGLDYLSGRPDVNSKNMGMWGFSNSGWVITNALNFTNKIAFLISVSGGGLTPREIEVYGYQNALKRGNFSEAEVNEGMRLVNQYLNYLADGQNREGLLESITAAKSKPWYTALNIGRVLPSEENRKNWSWVGNWSPERSIEKVKMPALIIFGEADMNTEPVASADRWIKGLKTAGNSNYELLTFKGASHGIRMGEHHASSVLFWQEFATGYVESVLNWMEKRK